MKAIEMFRNDQAGDELTRRRTDRKAYYCNLRQQLLGEIWSGGRCELMEHFAQCLAQGTLKQLYLLDAAAIWECFDILLEGKETFCDVEAQLPPFVPPLSTGESLSWELVQRLGDERRLPPVSLDGQLSIRLKEVIRCIGLSQSGRRCGGPLPEGLMRQAQLVWLQPEPVEPAQTRKDDAWRLLSRPTAPYHAPQPVMQQEPQPVRDAAEVQALRRQLAAAELMVEGCLREAEEQIGCLNGEISAALEQAQTLRSRQEQVQTRLASIRQDCVEAQQRLQAAEQELAQARESLSRTNEELRRLQRSKAETNAAEALMRLQIGRCK